NKKNIPVIIANCEGADLIVVNSLMPNIIPQLPHGTKIIWRFFGYEIYERLFPKVLSSDTLTLYNRKIKKSESIKEYLKKSILTFFPMLSSFNRSLKRVDYFMGAFREEYDFLKSLGFKLPPFLQVPLNSPS